MRIFSSQSQQLEIPTNGLVLLVDYAVNNCWLSGATVKDLSSSLITFNHTTAPTVNNTTAGRTANFTIPNNIGLITNNTVARLGAGAHTIIAFVRHAQLALNEDYDILGSGDIAVNGDYCIMVTTPGGLPANRIFRGHLITSTGMKTVDTATGSLANTNWHMLGQRYNGTNKLDALVNGIQSATTTTTGTVASSRTTATLGNRINPPNGGGEFKGDMSLIICYNRALTDAEVNQIWQVYRKRFDL